MGECYGSSIVEKTILLGSNSIPKIYGLSIHFWICQTGPIIKQVRNPGKPSATSQLVSQ